MSPDPMDLLERFAERRYVCLSEAEAAELGSGTLAEWREACRDGVHVDAVDYLEVLRDGTRYRRLCAWGGHALLVAGTIAAALGLIFLLGLWADLAR